MKCAKDPKSCSLWFCRHGQICRKYLFSLPIEERLRMRLRWLPLFENFSKSDLLTLPEFREQRKKIREEAGLPLIDTSPLPIKKKKQKQAKIEDTDNNIHAPYQKKRVIVYNKHKGICWLCEQPVDPHRFTIDHVIPISKGGTHHVKNLRPAHGDCNNLKSDLPIYTKEQFWNLLTSPTKSKRQRATELKKKIISEFERAKLAHQVNNDPTPSQLPQAPSPASSDPG